MYQRALVTTLNQRMQEPRRFMQVVVGPRQTGKTTAVRQAVAGLTCPVHFARASQDIPSLKAWLRREWAEGRALAKSEGEAVLVIDEVQLVDQWSAVVKALWDEDTDNELVLKVILTGSSSLLLQKGLREALTGRFELLPCYQWDLDEMEEAFGFSLNEYLYYGGYPGAAPFVKEEERWLDYMQNSIIVPSVLRDVISLDRITKPALMEALFTLGCSYSGQEISYRKLMGQLDDAGNATTIAHYLQLLSDAGLLAGIQKYTEKQLTTRASSPRLITFDSGLMTANYGRYRSFLLTDPDRKGHLVETAVGAYLLRRSKREHFDVCWWREGKEEVDFVITDAYVVTAIEVKSGKVKCLGGLDSFSEAFPVTKTLVVGSERAPLDAFLRGEIALF